MLKLMRFPDARRYLPEVDEWLSGEPDELYAIARHWFAQIRRCGDDVRELVHDGCPVACVGDAAFAYVNVFTAHVNVGFFLGALLDDPEGLLLGTGKRMRHVKLRANIPINADALTQLIRTAYQTVKLNSQS